VKNGKPALSKIVKTFNTGLPDKVKHASEKVKSILRGFDLTTVLSGGYSFLIWEQEKYKLFGKTSTTSTASTIEPSDFSPNVEVVEEVEVNSEVEQVRPTERSPE
jgi:hypothetical protein